ncbi:hypothetical protein HDV06_000129 [Boothiomyces sp. JEL0866]|nr:hypothetical protein HDV06_000129 [Boothiomyces sp. JEL0866]
MQIPSLRTYLQIPREIQENLLKNEWEIAQLQRIEESAKTIDTCFELMKDLDWQFKIVRQTVEDLRNIALIDPEFPSVTKPELCPGISVLKKRRIYLFELSESAFNSLEKSAEACKQFAEINYANANEIASVCKSNLSKKKQLIGDLQMEIHRRIHNVYANEPQNSWEDILHNLVENRKLSMHDIHDEKVIDESKLEDASPQYNQDSTSGNELLAEISIGQQDQTRHEIESSLKEGSVKQMEDDLDHCRQLKKVKLSIDSSLDILVCADDKENISESIQFRSQKSEGICSSTSPKMKLSVLKLSQETSLDGLTTEEELMLSLPKSSATVSQIAEDSVDDSSKTTSLE